MKINPDYITKIGNDHTLQIAKLDHKLYQAELIANDSNSIICRIAYFYNGVCIIWKALERLEYILDNITTATEDTGIQVIDKDRLTLLRNKITETAARYGKARDDGRPVLKPDINSLATVITLEQNKGTMYLSVTTVDGKSPSQPLALPDAPAVIKIKPSALSNIITLSPECRILYNKNDILYNSHDNYAMFRYKFTETATLDRAALSEEVSSHRKQCFRDLMTKICECETHGHLELFTESTHKPCTDLLNSNCAVPEHRIGFIVKSIALRDDSVFVTPDINVGPDPNDVYELRLIHPEPLACSPDARYEDWAYDQSEPFGKELEQKL